MAMVDVKKAELAATNAREQGKLQMSAMEKHAELEFQDRKLAQELAIAQEKIRAEMELGATELELKYKTTLAIESMKANVEGQKEAAKSSREEIANQLEHERTLALNEQAHAATMQDAKHKHEQALATIQATPAAPAPAAPAIEIHNNIPAPAKEKK
jgi:Fe2+ transport system protein B